MNLITFSPIDKYRRVQFIVYMVLIYIFIILFGSTMNTVSYEKECQKLFINAGEIYTFSPYIEESWDEWKDYRRSYLRSVFAAVDGIDYDAGIIDDMLFDDGEGLRLTETFYQHLNIDLKAGSGFSENPNEVILVNNHSGHKIGDRVTVSYEQDGVNMNRELEVVGIMRYPIMASETRGNGSSDIYMSMDGLVPYSAYVCDYLRWSDNKNVYLINPLLNIDADALKEDICYIYLKEDNIQTQGYCIH